MAGLLDGKSALITGGGGGIGRATALAFAREGARVAVADVSAEAARETVAQVNAAGGQAISLSGDVTRDADVRAMIEAVVGAYGRLDCAFNNAGIAGWQVEAAGKKTAEWSEEAFDRMIAVNLKGLWLCMRHELPQMQAQGGGNIVGRRAAAPSRRSDDHLSTSVGGCRACVRVRRASAARGGSPSLRREAGLKLRQAGINNATGAARPISKRQRLPL